MGWRVDREEMFMSLKKIGANDLMLLSEVVFARCFFA